MPVSDLHLIIKEGLKNLMKLKHLEQKKKTDFLNIFLTRQGFISLLLLVGFGCSY